MATDHPVLEPLSFTSDSDARSSTTSMRDSHTSDDRVQCLFCEELYNIPAEQNDVLKHLLLCHKFVIGDVKLIADLRRYLDYWRQKFKDKPVTDFCSVIQTNSRPNNTAPSEFYNLLCDALPEDKTLRTQLQQKKLEEILKQQQGEREDRSFSRTCLFCKEHFTENRSNLFDHMVQEHNFSVGRSDNLVYTNELLDHLEEKLKSLQCLYCEKTFKDRHVLKEHMRKKQHKKINPQNSVYDKFYIINYLELGKTWEQIQQETDRYDSAIDTGDESDVTAPDDEWGDWRDDGGAKVVCLYCKVTASNVQGILQHLKDAHQFDLEQTKVDKKLTFYQQIKLVNYIRRQVHQHTCPLCQTQEESEEALRDHLDRLGHTSVVPETAVWDQPQYFFPTYEDDALLFGLDDGDTETAGVGAVDEDKNVVAEDCPVQLSESILNDVKDQLIT